MISTRHASPHLTCPTEIIGMSNAFRQHPDGSVTYTVRIGDTIERIACAAFYFSFHRLPQCPEVLRVIKHITAASQLEGRLLRPGRVLEWQSSLK